MVHLGRMSRGMLPVAAIACLLVLSFAGLAPGQTVVIEATAPLEDTSELGISAALDSALESAVLGAMAMGLTWVEVHSAYVGDGYVRVQVLAAAQPPAGTGRAGDRAPETDAPAAHAAKILYDL